MGCSYRLGSLPQKEAEKIIQTAQEYRHAKPTVCCMLIILVETGGYTGNVNPEDYKLADHIVRDATFDGRTIESLRGMRGFASSFLGI